MCILSVPNPRPFITHLLCVNRWTGFTLALWKDLEVGGWGPEIPFLERIEKPVRKNGPPLTSWLHFPKQLRASQETVWSYFWEDVRKIWYEWQKCLTCSGKVVSCNSISASAYVRIVLSDLRRYSSLKLWFCPTRELNDIVTCILTRAKFWKGKTRRCFSYIVLYQ